MSRDDINKLITTALILPTLFFFMAYVYEDLPLSIINLTSFLLLAIVGGGIGGVYAYYTHDLFFKNSLITGLIPSIILMFIALKMGLDDLIILGDLCLIVSCWVTASELAFIKNKST